MHCHQLTVSRFVKVKLENMLFSIRWPITHSWYINRCSTYITIKNFTYVKVRFNFAIACENALTTFRNKKLCPICFHSSHYKHAWCPVRWLTWQPSDPPLPFLQLNMIKATYLWKTIWPCLPLTRSNETNIFKKDATKLNGTNAQPV